MRDNALKWLTVCLNHESGAQPDRSCRYRLPSSTSAGGVGPLLWGGRLGGKAPALLKVGIPPRDQKPPSSALTDRALMSRSPMIARTLPALRRALDDFRAREATVALV